MCLTINRGAADVTYSTCQDLAKAVVSIYGNGVTFAETFSCASFTTSTATVCALGLTNADSVTFYNNFNGNIAAFSQLSIQFNLVCVNTGPNQYDDCASITTCATPNAQLCVPCQQVVITYPFCKCDNTSGSTPFSFATSVTVSPYGIVVGKQANVYTFTLQVGPGFGPGAAETVAAKAEFYLHDSMRAYVLGSTVDGKFKPPGWGSADGQPDSYKVQFGDINTGSKGISASVANGVKVGVIVDASTTLSALSGKYDNQLYYSIFSPDGTYCPTSFVYPPSE